MLQEYGGSGPGIRHQPRHVAHPGQPRGKILEIIKIKLNVSSKSVPVTIRVGTYQYLVIGISFDPDPDSALDPSFFCGVFGVRKRTRTCISDQMYTVYITQ